VGGKPSSPKPGKYLRGFHSDFSGNSQGEGNVPTKRGKKAGKVISTTVEKEGGEGESNRLVTPSRGKHYKEAACAKPKKTRGEKRSG